MQATENMHNLPAQRIRKRSSFASMGLFGATGITTCPWILEFSQQPYAKPKAQHPITSTLHTERSFAAAPVLRAW